MCLQAVVDLQDTSIVRLLTPRSASSPAPTDWTALVSAATLRGGDDGESVSAVSSPSDVPLDIAFARRLQLYLTVSSTDTLQCPYITMLTK